MTQSVIPKTSSFTALYRGTYEPYTVTCLRSGLALPPRHDLRNHSPDGFAWGYAGSGPAQLALALVADYTGDDELALALYQDFKFAWVATREPESSWLLSGEEFERVLGPLRAAAEKTWFVMEESGVVLATPACEAPERILWVGKAVSYDHAMATAAKAIGLFDPKTGLLFSRKRS